MRLVRASVAHDVRKRNASCGQAPFCLASYASRTASCFPPLPASRLHSPMARPFFACLQWVGRCPFFPIRMDPAEPDTSGGTPCGSWCLSRMSIPRKREQIRWDESVSASFLSFPPALLWSLPAVVSGRATCRLPDVDGSCMAAPVSACLFYKAGTRENCRLLQRPAFRPLRPALCVVRVRIMNADSNQRAR